MSMTARNKIKMMVGASSIQIVKIHKIATLEFVLIDAPLLIVIEAMLVKKDHASKLDAQEIQIALVS